MTAPVCPFINIIVKPHIWNVNFNTFKLPHKVPYFCTHSVPINLPVVLADSVTHEVPRFDFWSGCCWCMAVIAALRICVQNFAEAKRLKVDTYMNMTTSGLRCEVAYWPTMTLGGTAQAVAAHYPNERTLDPTVCSYNRPTYAQSATLWPLPRNVLYSSEWDSNRIPLDCQSTTLTTVL